jgi:hypothetical protein
MLTDAQIADAIDLIKCCKAGFESLRGFMSHNTLKTVQGDIVKLPSEFEIETRINSFLKNAGA